MKLKISELNQIFQNILSEVMDEPEFSRSVDRLKFATDEEGLPRVKLAIGNMPLDYDLWNGLRNPATIGLHPAGFPEIWEFYANRRKSKVDEAGRPTIFQIPRSFEYALGNYNRAIIISIMLPFSQQVLNDYVVQVIDKKKGSSYLFSSMNDEINNILDKAITRVAIDMVMDDSKAVVIPMTKDNIKDLSTEAIPQTKQGTSHGPIKGGNYPQKSVAALLGLGQFGISRTIFRDELENNKAQRSTGSIRSIIIFDKESLVVDGSDGIIYPTDAWREFLVRLFNFTDTDSEINKYRFCSYIPLNDSGCGKCIEYCPTEAQRNSAPLATGKYDESVNRQSHRFWEGKLQFDSGKCCDERKQMSTLLPEWACSRCVTICADRGVRRKYAAQDYYQKMSELTGEAAPILLH